MILKSKIIDPARLTEIVADVSRRLYDGNVAVGPYAGTIGEPSLKQTLSDGRHVVNWTLTCRSSQAPGHRRVGSPPYTPLRRSIHASWQAHFDVMAAIYNVDPDAWIKTAVATYMNARDFACKAPATANYTVGSIVSPARLGDR